jgi:hypothetical protein
MYPRITTFLTLHVTTFSTQKPPAGFVFPPPRGEVVINPLLAMYPEDVAIYPEDGQVIDDISEYALLPRCDFQVWCDRLCDTCGMD